ncbi:zinc ribbon domain-containing protein [Pelosinus sp. sgz500959]|uniref:zinc ribbon domain-containing protein n=1 Tax=Pelosinus sp. sgz500959 TaxID=3242472 RepID=UPI0036728110
MPYANYKYCPFCGAHIPQYTMIKYCPFCGGSIILENNTVDELQKDEKKNLMNKVPTEISIDKYGKISMEKLIDSEYYSIVLKDAPNKQDLVRKLEKVLLRGYFAIRLAVDNIPSIIIYKAKGQDIPDFSQIFKEEEASISIIQGDFNHKPSVEEVCNFFDKLNVKTRQIIENMPINLWLGDCIQGVFPGTYKENIEGALVITDKNIYFVYKEIASTNYQWFVKSYNLLSKVTMKNNYLELISADMSVTNITFVDKENLSDAYQCIHRAVQSYKY